MTNLLNPDLQARMRGLARILTDARFSVHKIDTVISDEPLPDCPRCLNDRGERREAPLELFHDQGSIHTCWNCLIPTAADAAFESRDGWFHVEITQRSGAGVRLSSG